jgi:hypothetical protein
MHYDLHTKFHISASSCSDFYSAITKYHKVVVALSDVVSTCAKFCRSPSFGVNTSWEGTHMDLRMDKSDSLQNNPTCFYIIAEVA